MADLPYDDPRPSSQPIGTTELGPAKDNLITFDAVANSDDEAVTNRKGGTRRTLAGFDAEGERRIVAIEEDADARINVAIANAGYQDAGDYENDDPISNYNEYLVYQRGTNPTQWKVVDNTPLPYTPDSTTTPDPEDDDNLESFTEKVVVSSIAELQARSTSTDKSLYLSSDDRSDWFDWDESDLSTEVAADPDYGKYVPPETDLTGTSGAWVRRQKEPLNIDNFGGTYNSLLSKIYDGKEVSVFNAIPKSYHDSIRDRSITTDLHSYISDMLSDVSDNEASLVIPSGLYPVSDQLDIGARSAMIHQGAINGATLQATSLATNGIDFSGSNVVNLGGTGSRIEGMAVYIPTDVYDPDVDGSAGGVNGISNIRSGGDGYNAEILSCNVIGGYRGYSLQEYECKMYRAYARLAYDGLFVNQVDNEGHSVIMTDITNDGIITSAGFEGHNVHLVRCNRALYASLGDNVSFNRLYIDSPKQYGIELYRVDDAMFNDIFFYRVGLDGTAADRIALRLNESSRNKFFMSLESQTTDMNHSMQLVEDTSIDNLFVGWNTNPSDSVERNNRTDRLRNQVFLNCKTGLAKYNNVRKEDKSYISVNDGGGTETITVTLPGDYTSATDTFITIRGEFAARGGDIYRQFGTFVCPVSLGDSATTGSFNVEQEDGTTGVIDLSISSSNLTSTSVDLTITNNGTGGTLGYADIELIFKPNGDPKDIFN